MSTWDSLKNLAVCWEYPATAVVALVGTTNPAKNVAKTGLGLVLLSNPGKVFRTMDAWWSVMKHPWRWYRYVTYGCMVWKFFWS